MFNDFLQRINDMAQNATLENLTAVQRVQDDILRAYNFDRSLSEREKRVLYEIAAIVKNRMRAELALDRAW